MLLAGTSALQDESLANTNQFPLAGRLEELIL